MVRLAASDTAMLAQTFSSANCESALQNDQGARARVAGVVGRHQRTGRRQAGQQADARRRRFVRVDDVEVALAHPPPNP